MCIIVVKPHDKPMPSKAILKHCWDNNDDGAGYMFPDGKNVIIKKGFMKFDNFYKSLIFDYAKSGRFTPFVLHFRISTQAGVNEECTHPFPLSREMADLRKTRVKSPIAIAHNGVIDLTKSGYSTTVTYSDTMKFITDYASLIIKNKDFYKDEDTLLLLDRLVGGRLAIMDYEGHIQMIGDFKEDDGIFYSNETYKKDRVRRTTTTTTTSTGYGVYSNYYRSGSTYHGSNCNRVAASATTKKDEDKKSEDKKDDKIPPSVEEISKKNKDERQKILDNWYLKNTQDGFGFNFNENNCPKYYEGDDSYCVYCHNWSKCYGIREEDKKE